MGDLESTSVLIVGGGPTGLLLSALLSQQGVASLLVDRDAGPTDHPQAHEVNGRSMEILRLLGIDEAIYAESLSEEAENHIRFVASMSGTEYACIDLTPSDARRAELIAASPARSVSCAQDRVEPALAERARELAAERGARVEFETELVSLEDRGDGCRAVVRCRGEERTIEADWVVGCDGAGSPTRRAAGIEMVGPDSIAKVVGIYFRADLSKIAETRPSILFWVIDTESPGTVICMDGRERFVFHAGWDDAKDSLDRFDDAHCKAILERAIGYDAAPEIHSVRPWVMTAQVAATYRAGRVLLAGDAAHRFPPTGGYGMNTGLQDAHNLAWKLAAVIQGRADASLLDTYEVERKPIAQSNTDWSVRNALALGSLIGPGAILQATRLAQGDVTVEALSEEIQTLVDGEAAHFDAPGRDLGFHYEEGALVQDGTPLPARANPDLDLEQNARPGSRAPHLVVARDGKKLSTQDLFDGRFTLVATPSAAEAWRAAAQAQTTPIDAVIVGEDIADPEGAFPALFGISTGAVLVRPDGHVGWRTAECPSDPTAALRGAMQTILPGG